MVTQNKVQLKNFDFDLDNLCITSEDNLKSFLTKLDENKICNLCINNNISKSLNKYEKITILFKIYYEKILVNKISSIAIDDNYVINNFNSMNISDKEIDKMSLYCLKKFKEKNINIFFKCYTDFLYNDKVDLITKYINNLNSQKIIDNFINDNNINYIIDNEFSIDFNIENLKRMDNDILINKINNLIDVFVIKIKEEEKEYAKQCLNDLILKKYKDIIIEYVKNNTELDAEILLLKNEILENYIPSSNFKVININNFNLENLLQKFNLLDLYYINYKLNNYLNIFSLSKSLIIKSISENYFNHILYYINVIKQENKNKKNEILDYLSDNFISLFNNDLDILTEDIDISYFYKKINSYVKQINFYDTIKIYTVLYPNNDDIFYLINYIDFQKCIKKHLICLYDSKRRITIKNNIQLKFDIDEYLVTTFCRNNYFGLFNPQITVKMYIDKIINDMYDYVKTFPTDYLMNFIFKYNMFNFEEYYLHYEQYFRNNFYESINDDEISIVKRQYYEKIFCKFIYENILMIYSYFINENTYDKFLLKKISMYVNFKYDICDAFKSTQCTLEDCIDKVYERKEHDLYTELIDKLLNLNFKFERESKYFKSYMIKMIKDNNMKCSDFIECPICYEKVDNNNTITFNCQHHVCNSCYEAMHKNRGIYKNCTCCLCRTIIKEIYIKPNNK